MDCIFIGSSFLNEVLKKTGRDNISDLRIVEDKKLTPAQRGRDII
jgi:hypothetical protein